MVNEFGERVKLFVSRADRQTRRGSVPRVTIRTGFFAADGEEEVLSEYLCDWPGCANMAAHVVDVARELGPIYVVCHEHAAPLKKRAPKPGSS